MATEQEPPKRKRGRAAGGKTSTEVTQDSPATGLQETGAKATRSAQTTVTDEKPGAEPETGGAQERAGENGPERSPSPQPAGGLDLSRLLQEQINLAIQPVLQDFRQQLSRTVQQEVKQANAAQGKDAGTPARSTTAPQSAPPEGEQPERQSEPAKASTGGDSSAEQAKPAGNDGSSAQPAGSTADESATPEQQAPQGQTGTPKGQTEKSQPAPPQGQPPQSQPAPPEGQAQQSQPAAPEGEPEQSTPEAPEQRASSDEGAADGSESDDSQESSEQQGVRGLVKGPMRSSVQTAVQFVEEQAENVLQSALQAGVNALLAEATRATIERGVERGVHLALEKSTARLGDTSTVRELRSQTEATVLAILREALDAVYADELRANLQQDAEAASRELLHGNVSGALGYLGHVLETLVDEIVTVLRHQWHRLLRLLLRVILTALEDAPQQAERPRLSDKSGRAEESQSS